MPHILSPIPAKQFGYEEAAHLLNRAGFGGTPTQILTLSKMGRDDAIDYLIEWEQIPDELDNGSRFRSDIMQPLDGMQRQQLRQARSRGDEAVLEQYRNARQARQREDRLQMRDIQDWWLERMIETPRPMQEKLTLFWHGHFATGYRAVEDSWHMIKQNDFFRQHAGGNFKSDLVHGIIRDPAMIRYLNNNQNTRRAPNENLSRELMELFTLGEGNGYTESDIKEGARTLTGMTYRDDAYTFNQRDFDSSSKTIFGRSGQFDGDDFVSLIFTRSSSSWFVPWKLHRFFVDDSMRSDGDVQRAVNRMSRTFNRSNWELRPMLRELLRSKWFYAPENRQSIIKSPIQLTVQAVRTLSTPVRSIRRLNTACEMMGQSLFAPPSVKGWEGGQKWINTSTLFVRANLLLYLMTGRDPAAAEWEAARGDWNPEPLVAHLKDLPGRDFSTDAATYLSRLLLGAAPTDGRIEKWSTAIAAEKQTDRERLMQLISLITAAPEYQLC